MNIVRVLILMTTVIVALFGQAELNEASQQTHSPGHRAGTQQSEATVPAISPDTVVATVDEQTITAGEVRHFLAERFKHLPEATRTAAFEQPEIRAQALAQLIDRRIVFAKISADGFAASDDAVSLDVDATIRELEKTETTLESWLAEQGLSREQFEFEICWRLSWQLFLDRGLTDDFLEAHFERNRRELDGTEIQVSHILLKDLSLETVDTAREKLAAIKSEIESGNRTWKDAVAEHSEAPSATESGAIGWIRIDGPMEPVFTSAAFKLQRNEISPVVQSPFGLHLIKCTDIRPGRNGWRDIIEEVRDHATTYGFRQIVSTTRDQRTITYAGNWPRFGETGTLLLPER